MARGRFWALYGAQTNMIGRRFAHTDPGFLVQDSLIAEPARITATAIERGSGWRLGGSVNASDGTHCRAKANW
jgi:hypothetical protein